MIKQIANLNLVSDNPKMLLCDNCGEGLGINDSPDEKLQEYIKDFKKFHKDCKKSKHDIADEIKNAPEVA